MVREIKRFAMRNSTYLLIKAGEFFIGLFEGLFLLLHKGDILVIEKRRKTFGKLDGGEVEQYFSR